MFLKSITSIMVQNKWFDLFQKLSNANLFFVKLRRVSGFLNLYHPCLAYISELQISKLLSYILENKKKKETNKEIASFLHKKIVNTEVRITWLQSEFENYFFKKLENKNY